QIVSQDNPSGVSRFGGQAGTQAPDPTPTPPQNHGSRAGSTTHILPVALIWHAPWPGAVARRGSRRVCSARSSVARPRWIRKVGERGGGPSGPGDHRSGSAQAVGDDRG